MNLTASLKKAPKWAWYTAGGLGIAAAGVKVWQNRGGKTEEEIETVPGEVLDYGGGYPGGGGTPGVIVPPVIVPESGGDDGGLGGVYQLYMDGVGGVFAAWEALLGPVMATQQQVLLGSTAAIQEIAMAGGAPASVGIPVVSQEPIPQAPPVAIIPTPAPAPKPPDPCVGEYPNEHGGRCYKVVCASGNGSHRKGRWHFYKSGTPKEVWVRSTC